MAEPSLFFSPPLSPLSSTQLSSPPLSPQLSVQTPRNRQCYIVLQRLAPSLRSAYQPLPDYLGGDPEFSRDDLDVVVGEYPLEGQSNPSHYFVCFRDGLARRISSRTLLARCPDLVDDYRYRKEHGMLEHFDPASDDVHEHSRMNGIHHVAALQVSSEDDISEPSFSGSSTEDDDDTENTSFNHATTRKSARLVAGNRKLVQSRLPFSPKKLRSNRIHRERSASNSGDDLGGYGQIDSEAEILVHKRRSERPRKGARTNLADDFSDDQDSDGDTSYGSPQRKSRTRNMTKLKKRRTAATRPAYGCVRDIDNLDFDFYEDEATSSLRAHRDICEKCHKRPAHVQLMRAKKSDRRAKKDEGESDESDEDHIRDLGGWVRCLKCPVVAHWKCLAKSQRDEILRAARARDKDHWKSQMDEPSKEPSSEDLPDRKELDINQTTEFICGLCMKGGTCMGCLEVAVEPDASFVKKPPLSETAQGDPQDIEMVDVTLPTGDDVQPSRELLFRCFSCKRLAHYQHLPDPENAAWEEADLASYYQEETNWRCADCASYVYPLDKILAWRPFPPGVVEHTSAHSPDAKAFLPREYLVKWAERSFRRTQWVPHMWLVSTNLSKLKHFLRKGSTVPLLDEPVSDEMAMDIDKINANGADKRPIDFEPNMDVTLEDDSSTERKYFSLGPSPDAEHRIPLPWKTIDRVLDVRFWRPPSAAKERKKNKRVVRRDEVDSLSPDSQLQLEQAYSQGEQPDETFMEELHDWSSRTGKNLSLEHINEVVWVFVKWEDLGYEEATWDSPPRRGEIGYSAYERAFQHFINSWQVSCKKTLKEIEELEARKKDGYDAFALKRDLDEQPELGQNNQLKLMKFQIDGYNWLCDNWWNQQPSILADEMGLGKTVQIVTFLGTLIERFNAAPALVVVPNSTITNWVREFSRWAPRLRVVPFFGEAKSRDVIIRYELFHRRKREPKYHVLVTTYETVTNPRDFATVFKNVYRWEVLVVDEGQRLKSDSSLLFKKLNELRPIHRIIMTGTPLNNNIRELFNLMNFLDADKWRDLEALEKEYEELNEDLVRQLHARLKPYFLRRIKNEVLQLPPKNEVIVPLSLTPLQKEVYRSIISQNLDILKQLTQVSSINTGRAGTSRTNMNNILMQLRKCIQHPYLISDDIEPGGLDPHETHEKLIDASAKLRLLRPLLSKLKARGHRILLFSQFVMVLDILEDFLKGENYRYLRLDGETKQAARQKGMDEFNKPDSEYFIYLLTTRAGGVGINLHTADTVIIFDPDFNPHQDLQAIARSHRYGQQKTCLVFKLMVKHSAEERIMQTGKKKLVLDHLIVQKMDADENGSDDLRSILTFGAKALFEEGEHGSKDIVYTDHDLEKLIEKTEVERDTGDITDEPGLKFNFAKVWAAGKDTLEDIEDPTPDTEQADSWAQALERITTEKALTGTQEATGRGVRRKAAATFPQQQLDFLDGPDVTPAKGKRKGKRKGQSLRSGISSDSDAYDGSIHQNAGDDSDTTADSMDVGQDPVFAPALPKKQGHNLSTPFSNTPSQLIALPVCGLCGRTHASGVCEMVDNPLNLMEYRELLKHSTDEPWQYREAAIEAIEQTLRDRGQGHLLVGERVSQPEHASTSMKIKQSGKRDKTPPNRHKSTSVKAAAHRDSTGLPDRSLPIALPSKRMSSPDGLPENQSKKQKQNENSESCSVCLGPRHSIEKCPILLQDTRSITKQILRLSDDPSQAHVIKMLQHVVKKRKRESDVWRSQVAITEDPPLPPSREDTRGVAIGDASHHISETNSSVP